MMRMNLRTLVYGCAYFGIHLITLTLAADPVVVVGTTKDPGIPMMPGDPKWSPAPTTTSEYHDFGTVDHKYSTTTLKVPDAVHDGKSTTSLPRKTTIQPTRMVTQRQTKPKSTTGPTSRHKTDNDGKDNNGKDNNGNDINRIDLDKQAGGSAGRVCPFSYGYLTILAFTLGSLLSIPWR